MSREQERRIDALRWAHRIREWEVRVQSLRIAHVQRQTPLRDLTKGLLNALTRGTMVAVPPPARSAVESKPLEYKPRVRQQPTPKQVKRAKRRIKCSHDYVKGKQNEMDKKWGNVDVKCKKCGLRGWMDLATKKVNHWTNWLYE